MMMLCSTCLLRGVHVVRTALAFKLSARQASTQRTARTAHCYAPFGQGNFSYLCHRRARLVALLARRGCGQVLNTGCRSARRPARSASFPSLP